MSTETRWRQRFSNFQKALLQLEEAVEMEEYSKLERQGLIQCFEYTIELAWKTLQDILQARGYEVAGPKPVMKQAFQDGWIVDGEGWNDMLDSRQLTSHTYDEETAIKVAYDIREKYFPLLHDLDKRLSQEKGDA